MLSCCADWYDMSHMTECALFQVLRLQKLLNEEMELHAILENAMEQATITSSDLSSLPDNVSIFSFCTYGFYNYSFLAFVEGIAASI